MTEIRMNEGLRRRLYDLVDNTVTCAPEAAILEDAYKRAAPLVRAAVAAKYPPKDMEICAKYEVASVDDCIKLQLSSGGVDMFNFTPGTGPVVTKKTYDKVVYLANEETTDAFADWKKAKEVFDKAYKTKINDYGALIKEARTLEEITEIWPEADVVREYARSRALSILSDDMIARIKADAASRK